MPTLREALRHMGCLMVKGLMPGTNETHICYLVPDRLLDLTVIEGVGLVAMDVEAGAKETARVWADGAGMDAAVSETDMDDLKRILAACGIIVPDEVGVVEVDESSWYHGLPDRVLLNDIDITGRTVAVLPERNPSESPNSCQTGNSCTGESISHPQVTERE